jgi:hypothetical protein
MSTRNSERQFTVTYIVTNWDREKNERLIDFFLKIVDCGGVVTRIKLRPNSDNYAKAFYRSKARNFGPGRVLVEDGPIEPVLASSDMIVTFHSGVAVEAFAYGVPVVLLDIFEDIDLREHVNHYEDCFPVLTEPEYIRFVQKAVHDPSFYAMLEKKVAIVQEKYAAGNSADLACDFIYDFCTELSNA